MHCKRKVDFIFSLHPHALSIILLAMADKIVLKGAQAMANLRWSKATQEEKAEAGRKAAAARWKGHKKKKRKAA